MGEVVGEEVGKVGLAEGDIDGLKVGLDEGDLVGF